nr:MAG TPA: hypothetical protein [Caudoviricetes sp.]DAR30570.1 MAG TPA: hypothetical protein [Caudoviricetes sp.]
MTLWGLWLVVAYHAIFNTINLFCAQFLGNFALSTTN